MEGDSFTVPCTIVSKGLGIKTFFFFDTGTTGYVYANESFVKSVEQYLNVTWILLTFLGAVRGYDDASTQ